MTRMAPVYTVKWRSQVVKPNSRLHPTQASNVVAGSSRQQLMTIRYNPVTVILFVVVLGYHVVHITRTALL